MIKNPKISILCSVYNREKYVSETIQSILGQSYDNYELLIIDDGSKDNSYEVISSLGKKSEKIRYWKSENKGIIKQYNFLLNQVSPDSEYITWIDSDDVYTSDNLQSRVDVLKAHPGIAMIYNRIQFIDEKSKVKDMEDDPRDEKFFMNLSEKINIETLLLHCFVKNYDIPLSYGSLLIKKDVLKEVGIINPTRNDKFFIGDFDLLLRIGSKYEVYGLDKKILLYRKHDEQITGVCSQQMLIDILEIIQYLYKRSYISEKVFKVLLYTIKTKN